MKSNTNRIFIDSVSLNDYVLTFSPHKPRDKTFSHILNYSYLKIAESDC